MGYPPGAMKSDATILQMCILFGGLSLLTLVACGNEEAPEVAAPLVPACDYGEDPLDRRGRLARSESWMYQLAELDEDIAVDALAASEYPLLVIESGRNHKPCGTNPLREPKSGPCIERYDTEGLVDRLRQTPSGRERLLLAYVDIGQAESWRDYWAEDWRPPTASGPGNPPFILSDDPDGWSDNYVVAYWDPAWQHIWLSPDGIIATLAHLGFDGVYLDWVEAYDDPRVMEVAAAQGRNPSVDMIQFIQQISAIGRAISPGFLVVQQNANYLYAGLELPARSACVDGIAAEDTWYFGDGAAEDWEAGAPDYGYTIADRIACEAANCKTALTGLDNVCLEEERLDAEACAEFAVSGGLHGGERHGFFWSTADRLASFEAFRAAGMPIFTADYCLDPEQAQFVYAEARAAGVVPLVTRVTLSQMTETPP